MITTSMTLKYKFAVHICHKRQCHLIQYSLDAAPAAGLDKNKEQTNDLETNAASPTPLNSLTLHSFQTHNSAWTSCQKLGLKLARLHEERAWVCSLSESVSGAEGAFFRGQAEEEERAEGCGILFFVVWRGWMCLHGTEQSPASSPAPEAEAGWHVSTALH